MCVRARRLTITGEHWRAARSFKQWMTDQIDFVCTRADHQVTTFVEALTIHDEKWAYCPSAQTSGHEWRSCRAMSLDDLRGMLQRLPAARIAFPG